MKKNYYDSEKDDDNNTCSICSKIAVSVVLIPVITPPLAHYNYRTVTSTRQ